MINGVSGCEDYSSVVENTHMLLAKLLRGYPYNLDEWSERNVNMIFLSYIKIWRLLT